MQSFNKTWTSKYLFTEVKGKAVCLVCGAQIAVFKDYSLNRHCESKSTEKHKNSADEERARPSEDLLEKLQRQQGFFTKLRSSRDAAVRTSLVISHKTGRNNKLKPVFLPAWHKHCTPKLRRTECLLLKMDFQDDLPKQLLLCNSTCNAT
ncbi:hypothetical protein AOLI_G00217510 [Acnodon oligacanthus]